MPYKIINWEEYQGRKNRGSNPWVKLYKKILTCADFFDLPIKVRWQWPLLLCIAHDHSGIIEHSDARIAWYLHIREFDPNPFIGNFLIRVDASGTPVDASGTPEATASYSLSSSNKKEKVVALVPGFDEFWQLYPKKINKQRARDAWRKLRPDRDLKRLMRKGLEAHIKSREWNKNDGEFIPYASSWMNEARWGDELTPMSKPKPRRLEPHETPDTKPAPDASDAEWARWLQMPEEEYTAKRVAASGGSP